MDLNRAQIIGNITQDIELRQTPSGQNVTSFSVATNRNWTDNAGMRQEQAEFHNIVLWWKLAEIAAQYLGKWKKVYVEGRLQTRTWEAQDGTKRYKTEIVWTNLIMLDKAGGADFEQAVSTSDIWNDSSPVQKANNKAEEEISVEDIPF